MDHARAADEHISLLRRGGQLVAALAGVDVPVSDAPSPAEGLLAQVRAARTWVADLEQVCFERGIETETATRQGQARVLAPPDLVAEHERLQGEVAQVTSERDQALDELARVSEREHQRVAAAQIDDEITDLLAQVTMLERRKAAILGGTVAPETVTQPASPAERHAPAVILGLLDRTGEALTPSEIQAKAALGGDDLTPGAVRSALNRLKDRGEVAHDRASSTWRSAKVAQVTPLRTVEDPR